MWYPLLVFGSIIFWIVIGLDILVSIIFIYNEKPKALTCYLIGVIAFFQLFSNVNIWKLFVNNWFTWVCYFVVYLIVGFVWSIFKFKMKTLEHKKLLETSQITSHSAEYQCSFEALSSDVASWVTYWPFYVIVFLIEDFITKIITFVWDACLVGIFKRIYNNDVNPILRERIKERDEKGKRRT